jgi:hypothetical protein
MLYKPCLRAVTKPMTLSDNEFEKDEEIVLAIRDVVEVGKSVVLTLRPNSLPRFGVQK